LRWDRPPQDGIPPTKAERERLLWTIRRYVDAEKPVPPLSLDELHGHASRVVELAEVEGKYRDWISVLLNNAAWSETVAGIPYERRLLLLPQCLRDQEGCAGEIDEFGLVCHHCGRCRIHELQEAAEKLGYAVLVAEGTVVVTSLVRSGKIDAVVGASCMSSLERVFPYMEAGAIPGIAIPLLYDGCANTTMDLDWLWDAIHLTRDDRTRLLDLDALRAEVQSWFALEALDAALGPTHSRTEQLARQWLARSGKRWRPFLALCAYRALQADPAAAAPDDLRKIAIAIECFHKASLVHDDIEDNDAVRYGEQTLHKAHGVPIALNVGDFLLGEGYHLIAESRAPDARRAEMLHAATRGHRSLCVGQGEELCWMRNPVPLSPRQVLDIFRHKTAPAFEVALRLGAIYAGASEGVWAALHEYSDALGIAYQIRDDLEDFCGEATRLPATIGPSILLAIAYEDAEGDAERLLAAAWRHPDQAHARTREIEKAVESLKARERARELLASYKERAIRSLRSLDNASLKGLLRRVISKIFNEIEAKG
jgi:geranylgeranyl pyrophosphate synthase